MTLRRFPFRTARSRCTYYLLFHHKLHTKGGKQIKWSLFDRREEVPKRGWRRGASGFPASALCEVARNWRASKVSTATLARSIAFLCCRRDGNEKQRGEKFLKRGERVVGRCLLPCATDFTVSFFIRDLYLADVTHYAKLAFEMDCTLV